MYIGVCKYAVAERFLGRTVEPAGDARSTATLSCSDNTIAMATLRTTEAGLEWPPCLQSGAAATKSLLSARCASVLRLRG